MIVGIGHDLVSAPRIARLVDRYGARFLDRVFSSGEQDYCRSHGEPAPHLAARFAAKEAFYKALARGRALEIGFLDAQVVRAQQGALELDVSPRARALMSEAGASRIHLSLTHDGDYASAVVVLER